jgi:pantoate--beta-alanine ligase
MKVARTIIEFQEIRDAIAAQQPLPTVAFVPTMGAIHAGHRSLFQIARNVADIVVVSIFVNPLQFGANEDYARYPRVLEHDLDVCGREGIDLVFAPSVLEVYPAGRQVSVTAGPLGSILEGASRPGHFDGVLTVVAKLFNIVRPDKAIFGQKDAQQLACVRRLVADLDFDVDIVAGPTIREADGLALSSRNRYLMPHERKAALALSAALQAAARQESANDALEAARSVLSRAENDSPFALEYLALVHPQTFSELGEDGGEAGILLVAAKIGETHLIDNVALTFSPRDMVRDDVQSYHDQRRVPAYP